jgi:hypothetical protein
MQAKREEIQTAPAEDKGVWKDSGLAFKRMQERAQYVYNATDGKAHIALMVYRPELSRNKISWFGELLTQSMAPFWPSNLATRWFGMLGSLLQSTDHPCAASVGLCCVSSVRSPPFGCAVLSATGGTVQHMCVCAHYTVVVAALAAQVWESWAGLCRSTASSQSWRLDKQP